MVAEDLFEGFQQVMRKNPYRLKDYERQIEEKEGEEENEEEKEVEEGEEEMKYVSKD